MNETVYKLIRLRDFLVPENEPDRLVKHGMDHAEDDAGNFVFTDSPYAARFCIWGGIHKLFGRNDPTHKAITDFSDDLWKIKHKWFFGLLSYVETRHFWFCCAHTAEEVREFLNAAIDHYSKEV